MALNLIQNQACSVSSLSIQLALLFSLDNNWFQVFSQSLPKFKILDLRCSFYKFCFISTLHFCSCISRKFSLCSFYKFCIDGTDTTLGQQMQYYPWIWWKWDVNVVSRGGRTGVATLERVCRVRTCHSKYPHPPRTGYVALIYSHGFLLC